MDGKYTALADVSGSSWCLFRIAANALAVNAFIRSKFSPPVTGVNKSKKLLERIQLSSRENLPALITQLKTDLYKSYSAQVKSKSIME
jgi:hypothetical protein